jgi:beta-N-acetylhexosaminidase
MFVFGFSGTTLTRNTSRLLKELHPGGLVVFGRNISSASQIAKLNRQAQELSYKASEVPLFLAVDQEGGTVTRIKVEPPLPSGLEIGGSSDVTLAEAIGRQTGQLLSLLGFNMNLAPVLDLNDPRKDSFLGTRSFGIDPDYVGQLTGGYVKGLLASGIIPTAKHFPGHGTVNGDSHQSLPVSNLSRDDLLKTHLRPYFHLTKEYNHSSAIMAAHIVYSKIDSDRPATFSKAIIDGILRKEIGYDGIVMTDDIQMAAASLDHKPIGERAILAIEAGVDMMMVTWGRKAQAQAVAGVIAAVKGGRISQVRIDASVRRILTTKSKVIPFGRTTLPTKNELQMALESSEMRTASFLIFKKNFARAIEDTGQPQLAFSSPSRVLVFSGSGIFHRGFSNAARSLRSKHFPFSKSTNFLSLFRNDPSALGVVHVTGDYSAKLANSLPPSIRKQVILINSDAPGVIKDSQDFAGVYNILSRHPQSGAYVGRHIQKLIKELRSSEAARSISSQPEPRPNQSVLAE